MASKAFEQIKAYLDKKEIHYDSSGEGESKEKFIFGMNGEVQQWFIFIIESELNTVQFRSVQILDETDLKHYHDPSKKEHRVKLYEYLLNCNYQWRLGKFALDPEDEKVDLYFVISDYVETDKGIEKELLDRVWNIFIGSFGASSIEEAIKNIKSILATGEKLPEESEEDKVGKLLAALKSADMSAEPAKAEKGVQARAKEADDFEDGI